MAGDDGAVGADQGISYKKGRIQRPKTGAAHNAAGGRAANIASGFQHKGLLSAKSAVHGRQARASANQRIRQTPGEASGLFNFNTHGEGTVQRNISTAGYSSAMKRGLEKSVGAGSTRALSGRLLGCTTATALSRVVPKTNIPVIDEYYRNFDTQGQIDQIKFITEFQRLREKIEKYWHVKQTPLQEREKVRPNFTPLLDSAVEAEQLVQLKTLNRLERYLTFMKSFYNTETSVRNIYQERANALEELTLVSRSFDQEQFEAKGIRLILSIRFLTVQLVHTIKKWKAMLQRATATFFIADATAGNGLGKVVYKDEQIEKKQLYSSLKPSSRLDSAVRRSAVAPRLR